MIRRIFSILFLAIATPTWAETPNVVVTIPPIHSLVAGVMKGVSVPKLLLSSHEDAHHFSFSPSDAKMLSEADIFIWVGPQMELVLEKPIKTLGSKARLITLLDLPGIKRYDLEPGHLDPHIWLDPENAKVIVRQVAEVLSGVDPNNSGLYDENSRRIQEQLDKLSAKIREELNPVKTQQYFVYHDAFQYFEKAFGLKRSVPLVKDTEGTLRASQRQQLEKIAKENNIRCLFGEPKHGESVVEGIAEQLNLKISYLDPMGLADKASPEGSYITMMEDVASTIKACLAKESK